MIWEAAMYWRNGKERYAWATHAVWGCGVVFGMYEESAGYFLIDTKGELRKRDCYPSDPKRMLTPPPVGIQFPAWRWKIHDGDKGTYQHHPGAWPTMYPCTINCVPHMIWRDTRGVLRIE